MYIHSIMSVGKKQLFWFLSVGLCVGKNQMCCLCGWVSMKHNVSVYGVVAIPQGSYALYTLLYAVFIFFISFLALARKLFATARRRIAMCLNLRWLILHFQKFECSRLHLIQYHKVQLLHLHVC